MTLQILPQIFTVCKVPEISAELLQTPFCFTAVTDTERSLLCPTPAVPQSCTERSDGWRGLRVKGTLDFALIGILARLTALLAEHAVSVFAVSTYDTDYLFVRESQWTVALNVLRSGGYGIE